MLSLAVGNVLCITDRDGTDVAIVPKPIELALTGPELRRTLGKDPVSALLRAAARPSDADALHSAATFLEGFARLDAWLRATRVRDQDLLRIAVTGRRVHEARVRTGHPGGAAWDARLLGPVVATDAWRDVSEDESRAWLTSVLGPMEPRGDGSFRLRGHAPRAPRRGTAWPRDQRFEPRERDVEITFVEHAEHPDFRALFTVLSRDPERPLRFSAG